MIPFRWYVSGPYRAGIGLADGTILVSLDPSSPLAVRDVLNAMRSLHRLAEAFWVDVERPNAMLAWALVLQMASTGCDYRSTEPFDCTAAIGVP